MRKTLRIIFIIVAIAVVGLGIYFAFFGVDRNLSVYNKANDVLQYKYNLDVYGDMLGLDELGYANNTEFFSESNYPEIYTLRQKMFAVDEKLQGGSSDGELFYYYGYAKYEEILTEGIRYYANYASLAKEASKRYSNVVGSVLNNYKSAIANVYDRAKDVIKAQTQLDVEGSGMTSERVLSYYEKLRTAYRDYLKKSATVITELRDYIIKESFDKNFSFDTISVLYDSIAETMITTMNSKIEQEINYLHDLSIFTDKYYEYIETGSINYGFTDEINYLLAYKKLYFEDRKDYDKIFDFTHFQKYDLIHGKNNISTTIQIDFVDTATIVVALLEL